MKWNESPYARSRQSIGREAGRVVGTPAYSVKKPPIPTLPIKSDEPLITTVAQDTLHMRCRIGERITDGAVDECAKHTKDKYAEGFQTLVRLTGVPFEISEKHKHGKREIGYSSLTGVHWQKVLSKIGPIIRSSKGVFSDKKRDEFADLYEEFNSILEFAGNCRREDADALSLKTSLWTRKYIQMGFKVRLGK